MMLCDFNFTEKKLIVESIVNQTSNRTNDTNESYLVAINEKYIDEATAPSILHFILMFWIFSLFCEELRQVRISEISIMSFFVTIPYH